MHIFLPRPHRVRPARGAAAARVAAAALVVALLVGASTATPALADELLPGTEPVPALASDTVDAVDAAPAGSVDGPSAPSPAPEPAPAPQPEPASAPVPAPAPLPEPAAAESATQPLAAAGDDVADEPADAGPGKEPGDPAPPPAPNHPPVAHADTFSVLQGQITEIPAPGPLANDTDPDGDPITLWGLDGQWPGEMSVQFDGAITYVAPPGFVGTRVIDYGISDGTLTAWSTLTIEVEPGFGGGPAPIGVDDAYSTASNHNLVVPPMGLIANDSHSVPGTKIWVFTHTQPTVGEIITFDTTTASFTYEPKAGFTGTDTFTYMLTDGSAITGPHTVEIEVTPAEQNSIPVPVDDALDVLPNQPLTLPLSAIFGNDVDADGDIILFSGFQAPAGGYLPGEGMSLGAGTFTYTPPTDYEGTRTVRYKISDGKDVSKTLGDIVFTIKAVPMAPTGTVDSYAVLQDTAMVVAAPGVLFNDSDANGDVLQASLVSAPQVGTLDLHADGSFEYVPPAGFVGFTSFVYRAEDATEATGPIAVTIEVFEPRDGSGDPAGDPTGDPSGDPSGDPTGDPFGPGSEGLAPGRPEHTTGEHAAAASLATTGPGGAVAMAGLGGLLLTAGFLLRRRRRAA